MSYDTWIVRKLGEVTINHDKKRIPLSTMERTNRKGKYPYYGAQGIIDYIDDYIFEGRYLLIAEDGANLQTRSQDIASLTSFGEKFWVNNHAHILSSNELSDIRYIMYYLNHYDISGYITGSAQPKLNQTNLNSIEINLPSFQEQKAIANILSSLDDKIELNNKIIKNLEEMAQTLYKRWFVDFEFPNEDGEPYKSSGGEMIESEIGLIPNGWELVKLKNMFKFIKGKKPKGITEIFNKDLKEYLTLDVLKGKANSYANKEKAIIVDELDVTMVMDGASSGTIYYGKSGILSSTLALLKPLKEYNYSSYLFSTTRYFEDAIKERQTGSAIPHTDKNYVYSLEIPYNKETVKIFNEFISDFRKEVIVLSKENLKLSKARDTLLPKLMSGEIEVPVGE